MIESVVISGRGVENFWKFSRKGVGVKGMVLKREFSTFILFLFYTSPYTSVYGFYLMSPCSELSLWELISDYENLIIGRLKI